MAGFLSLDELGDLEDHELSAENITPPDCGDPNPYQCFSPNSAQKAVLSGALQAVQEHEDDTRRRSIQSIENKRPSITAVTAAAEEEDDEQSDETLWVRSKSGEHSLDARNEIYLQSEWDIYYDGGSTRGMSDQDWENRVQKIGSFDSVQLFWRYWNNLPFSQLPIGSSMRFFKTGIEPNWDDPQNQNGGKWVLKPTAEPEQLFSDVALALIGGALPSAESVCGVIYSIKPKGVVISIWNSDAADKTQVNGIASELREMCDLKDTGVLQYMDHKGTMKFNETVRQKASQEKPQKKGKGKQHQKEQHQKESHPAQPLALPLPLPKPAAPRSTTTAASDTKTETKTKQQPQKQPENSSKPPVVAKAAKDVPKKGSKKEKKTVPSLVEPEVPVVKPKPKAKPKKTASTTEAAASGGGVTEQKSNLSKQLAPLALGLLLLIVVYLGWSWRESGELIVDDEV